MKPNWMPMFALGLLAACASAPKLGVPAGMQPLNRHMVLLPGAYDPEQLVKVIDTVSEEMEKAALEEAQADDQD